MLVRLRVVDDDGQTKRDGRPIMAAFTFTDSLGRIYPSPSRRLAPDFNFHFQIYRADGETIALQPGSTPSPTRAARNISCSTRRSPCRRRPRTREEFRLKRWIHPAAKGWYSGDHHIHAAGCAHYESPTEGVTPEDMMRHVLGEDLNVGCCLSWGPCWYHQKRYFEGKVNPLSTPNHLLRYDVEVSGFPVEPLRPHLPAAAARAGLSRHQAHRRLAELGSADLQVGQGTRRRRRLRPQRLGTGRRDRSKELPNYLVPPMYGIGANEYIVDVTQGMCDFISTVDTPAVWELNIWYHTLNCGYRCRISGETDFPCIYGERVGLGRSYVHLDGKLDLRRLGRGHQARPLLRQRRQEPSDGLHGQRPGRRREEQRGQAGGAGRGGDQGEGRGPAGAEADAGDRDASARRRWNAKPYWDIERARIGDTRKVPVEVVVNGQPVARKEIVADGTEQEVTFRVPIKASSWVCPAHLPVEPHQPGVRAGRRQADPGEQALGGVVPEGGR